MIMNNDMPKLNRQTVKACLRAFWATNPQNPSLINFLDFAMDYFGRSWKLNDLLATPALFGGMVSRGGANSSKTPDVLSTGGSSVKQYIEKYKSREGQTAFKKRLIKKYGCACMATGVTLEAIIEAAHISPFRRSGNHKVENGLLLSGDVHKLFDDGRLCFDPDSGYATVVTKEIADAHLQLLPALQPDQCVLAVDVDALRERYNDFRALHDDIYVIKANGEAVKRRN